MNNENNKGNLAKKTYYAGGVKLSVWENEREGNKYASFKLEKNYKDSKGEWQKTEYYSLEDIGQLLGVINKFQSDSIKVRENETKN